MQGHERLPPEGRAIVVGIDYSSYEAVLCGLPTERLALSDKPVIEVVPFRQKKQTGEDGQILAMKQARTAILSSKLYWQADVFWIEHGVGGSRKADWVLGAFFGILIGVCAEQASTNQMEAREWKKEISASCGVVTKSGSPGNGSLKKEAAHVYVRQVALKAQHDVVDYSPDALDAYAIATVGRWLNERQLQEAE